MGGYVFYNEAGKEVWRLNLRGAIIWYGLIEELFPKELRKMTMEEHNWGHLWDAAHYQSLANECMNYLQSDGPLPESTDTYRQQHDESVSEFRRKALSLFRDSLRNLPEKDSIYVVDDLNADWWEEPCGCEICRAPVERK